MGSNLHESLLPGSNPLPPASSSSPSRTAAAGSDDDTKVDRTPQRLPPPPPASQPLPVDTAKNGTSLISTASSSPSRVSASSSEDVTKADGGPRQLSPPPASPRAPVDLAKSGTSPSSTSRALPAAANANANVGKTLSPHVASDADEHSSDSTNLPAKTMVDPSTGLQDDLEAPGTSLLRSPSSPALPSRGWWRWGLQRRVPRLPVTAPPPPPAPGRSFNWFHEWKETNRPKAPRLDSVGVEKVIGIYGFSLFGSISLLPSTLDQVKMQKLTDEQKTNLMMLFGSIWVLASVGLHCGLHGKTDFEQAVCRFTGRLGVLALVLLVIFHIRGALPDDNSYNTPCYILAGIAALLHFCFWVSSCIVGEDRMEDAAPADEQQ